jgi:hypothetical protein
MKSLVIGLWLGASPAWVQAGQNLPLNPTPKVAEPPADSAVKVQAFSGQFEIVDKTVELGRHDQGELVTGVIKFKGPQFQVESIRATGLPGFQIRGIDWKDSTTGTMRFAIDTSLFTENISKTVVFQPINSSYNSADLVKPDSATISLQIKGKVSIFQLPQSEVAKREGMVELEIRNLGDTRFKVETVIVPGERSITFVGEENLLPMLGSGESAILPVFFVNTSVSKDPELVFKFTPGLFANNTLYFRLDLSKAQLRPIDR